MPGTATPSVEAARERAGSRVLSLFSRVLTARVLRAHAEGPLSASDLEGRMGWAARASLRVATANLRELGALREVEPTGARRVVATELTEAGQELLAVADALERWLAESPFGPLSLPDTPARGAVRALVAGWDSTIVSVLAEKPRSLAELSAEIPEHSYPTLKRRFAGLRSVNLISPVNGGRSPVHGATGWLRTAAGPLSAAGRWEQRCVSAAPPMTGREIEAVLMLAVPLIERPESVSGKCVLAAPASPGAADESAHATVSLELDQGKVISCKMEAEATPTAWILGTPGAWLDAMIDGNSESLRLRGADLQLAASVVEGLHEALNPGLPA